MKKIDYDEIKKVIGRLNHFIDQYNMANNPNIKNANQQLNKNVDKVFMDKNKEKVGAQKKNIASDKNKKKKANKDIEKVMDINNDKKINMENSQQNQNRTGHSRPDPCTAISDTFQRRQRQIP